jgi:hypothetical protein
MALVFLLLLGENQGTKQQEYKGLALLLLQSSRKTSGANQRVGSATAAKQQEN